MKTVKMTGVSNLISEYHSIKRFMIKYNDKHVSQYIERLHNLLQNSQLMLAKKRNEIKDLNKQIEVLKERLESVGNSSKLLSNDLVRNLKSSNSMLAKEDFWSKARYLYEIASYLGVDRRKLKAWIEDIEGVDSHKGKKLYTPKEVRIIVEYLGC